MTEACMILFLATSLAMLATLGLTFLNAKLYTEFFKQRVQENRERSRQ